MSPLCFEEVIDALDQLNLKLVISNKFDCVYLHNTTQKVFVEKLKSIGLPRVKDAFWTADSSSSIYDTLQEESVGPELVLFYARRFDLTPTQVFNKARELNPNVVIEMAAYRFLSTQPEEFEESIEPVTTVATLVAPPSYGPFIEADTTFADLLESLESLLTESESILPSISLPKISEELTDLVRQAQSLKARITKLGYIASLIKEVNE